MEGGVPAYDICGWTYQPRGSHLVADRERVARAVGEGSAMSVDCGGTSTSTPVDVGGAGHDGVDGLEHLSGEELIPRVSQHSTTAQAPARGPPDLVDCIVEFSIV